MNKFISLVAGIVLSATIAQAGEHGGVHWGYPGKSAPEHWGDLSPQYEMCKIGKNQSPVNIRILDAYDVDLEQLIFSYYAKTTHVSKSHGIKVAVDPGNFIVIDGNKFKLKQFHFHSPSETMVNGYSFPLEAHLVHVSDDGQIAVIAVFFDYGNSNPLLERIFSKAPAVENVDTSLVFKPEEIMQLIPENREYYRYNGSLTTPPCTEGVRWIVMKKPLTVSKKQIKRFKELVPYSNNRPVQPLNARFILK